MWGMLTSPIVWVHGYPFSVPVPLALAPDRFRSWSGVYIVAREQIGENFALDVGESQDIGDRVISHDRRWCWNIHRFSQPIVVYAHVENDPFRRLQIEADLRARLDPPCGKR
jgi:hypothetical protein